MRPCSSCRSEDTVPLEQSFLTRLVSSMGGEPTLRAHVCRVCRHVDFWIDEEHVATTAVVRTRDPGVGMGIEFTGLTEDSKNRFQAHLDQLDPGMATLSTKPAE